MKRQNVLFLITISSAFLLFGCGKKEVVEPVTEATVEEAVVETTEAATEISTVDEDLPPEEGMVRSKLTNEWVTEEVGALRPLAVMIPDDKSALPQYNISAADILYEAPVEGELTRLMAVFGDWTTLERVGNIRSCRDYFVYWAFEWDAIYCHFGGPFYIDEVIGRDDTNNINGLTAPSGVYYRTTDRSAPQNAYLDGKDIVAEANRLGYSLTPRDNYADAIHYQFATKTNPNTLADQAGAVDALKIDLADAYPITQTWFEYNSDDGLYYRFQKPSGGAHMDAANNTQLAFKNVLIQFTYYEVRDAKGYLAFQDNDTTRDGWFFTNGKGIHVNWKKTADYSPTKYYDDAGNEIQLNTGKTMVCVVEDGDTFKYEN